jgi:hypothetical protein
MSDEACGVANAKLLVTRQHKHCNTQACKAVMRSYWRCRSTVADVYLQQLLKGSGISTYYAFEIAEATLQAAVTGYISEC